MTERRNTALYRLRREKTLVTKLSQFVQELDQYTHLPKPQLAYEIQDSLLSLAGSNLKWV